MKFSKILVGFAAVMLLASCGNPAPESESTPESTPTTQHTISFHANWNYGEPVDGEPAVKTLTVDAGTVVATESIPVADERPGYAFKTWCTTPAATIAFDWTRAIERDYDVYASWVDLSNVDELSVVGTLNNWDPTNDDYLLETTDGIHYSLDHFLLKAGDIWKVVVNDAWEGVIDGNTITEETDATSYTVLTEGLDAGNIKMLASGYYDITVDLSAAQKLTFVKVEEFVDANPIVDYEIYLAGTFTTPQWGADESTKFTGPEAATGTWTLTDYEIPAGDFKLNVFAIHQDGTKDAAAWVGASAIAEMPAGWSGADNISAVAGTYTLSYEITGLGSEGVLTITGEASGPILSVIGYYAFLTGGLTGWTTDPMSLLDYMLMGEGLTGTYQTTVTLVEATELKILLFPMYEDGSFATSPHWIGADTCATLPDGWENKGGNFAAVAGTYTIAYTIADEAAPTAGTTTITALGGGSDTEYTIADPEAGTPVKLGFYQGHADVQKHVFFAGTMDGHYGASTDDKDLGVDIYCMEEGEGWVLKFLDPTDWTPRYINAELNGTYKNFVIGTDAATATVWTYDTAHQTFLADLDGTNYFIGTRNDKTYTTFSLCAEKYIETNFIAHLYW